MDVVASTLNTYYFRMRELSKVDGVWVLYWEGAVKEEGWGLEILLLLLKTEACDVVNVGYEGIKVASPSNSLMVTGIWIGEVVSNQVSDAFVRVLAVD